MSNSKLIQLARVVAYFVQSRKLFMFLSPSILTIWSVVTREARSRHFVSTIIPQISRYYVDETQVHRRKQCHMFTASHSESASIDHALQRFSSFGDYDDMAATRIRVLMRTSDQYRGVCLRYVPWRK